MTKLHQEDTKTAHVARVLVIMIGIAEAGLIVTMFLMMICVGYDSSFEYSMILALTAPYLFTFFFVIAVAFLPYAEAWQRGVILGLMTSEIICFVCSLFAAGWRWLLYGMCDDEPCVHEKDCTLVIAILNTVLAVMSAVNVAMAILLFTNTEKNPIRHKVLEERKKYEGGFHVQIKDDDGDVPRKGERKDDEGDQEVFDDEEEWPETTETAPQGESNVVLNTFGKKQQNQHPGPHVQRRQPKNKHTAAQPQHHSHPTHEVQHHPHSTLHYSHEHKHDSGDILVDID